MAHVPFRAAMLAAAIAIAAAPGSAAAQTTVPAVPAPPQVTPTPTATPIPAPTPAATSFSIRRPAGGTITVQWPVTPSKGRASAVAGAALRVVVSQTRRRSRPVTVAFGPEQGRKGRRTKTLRTGTFKAAMPTTPGMKRVLSLSFGTKVVRRTVIEVVATSAAPTPAPTPTPTPVGPVSPCDTPTVRQGSLVATLAPPTFQTIDRSGYPTPLPAVVLVSAALTNVGTGCFGRPGVAVERFSAGAWSAVPTPPGVGTTAEYYVYAPGQQKIESAFMAADSPAGQYRLRVTFTRGALMPPAPSPDPGSAEVSFTWNGPAPAPTPMVTPSPTPKPTPIPTPPPLQTPTPGP